MQKDPACSWKIHYSCRLLCFRFEPITNCDLLHFLGIVTKMIDQIIRSRRVVTPLIIGPASVYISEGKFVVFREGGDIPAGIPLMDAGNSVVMTGIVDAHVHVNEPGRTEWEGYETATKAAAAGGVTTIVDMPLNSIPVTTTPPALEQKARAAAGRATVDYAFLGGVVPGNTDQLAPLARSG